MSKSKKSTKKPAAPKAGPASPKALAEARRVVGANLQAIAAADQENAKKRDQRAASKDGKAPSERAIESPSKPKRMSALDAAAQVLKSERRPMTSIELVMAMDERGLWSSPKGKTPAATLYAAMLREVAAKGKDARFTKVDRGQFAAREVA